MLVERSCCPLCGQPSLDAYEAVNQSKTSEWGEMNCPHPGDVPCAPCEPSAPNPNLIAICEAGQCKGIDISKHDLSACSVAADCRLRNGTTCCEHCSVQPDGMIALANDKAADFITLVCEPTGGACPPCEPQYPPGTTADCIDGHCAVVIGDTQ